MIELVRKLLIIGTKPSRHEVENRSISISNVIYISLPIVYIIFILLDINAYTSQGWMKWDRLIVPLFIILCLFFLWLNHKGLSLPGRVLFLLSWPVALHIIPIIHHETPSDYYLAFPIGLIFHAVLIQSIIRGKRHPVIFYTFLAANFILMLFFVDFLTFFDTDAFESGIPFLGSRYYKLDGILYWLLFNFVTFYLLETLDYRDSQMKKRHDQLYVKNNLAGISFWEFKNPMPLSLQPKEQINWAKEFAILKECNDLYATYYGYKSSEDIIGFTFLEVLQNDEEVFENVIGEAIENNWTFFLETEEVNKNGDTFWFLNWLVPSIENQKLSKLHITQIDISRQKLAENSEAKLLVDLKEYAFLTSHKLRAPLSNILGVSNLLDTIEDRESLPEILKMLKTSSTEMDNVIREMNDILSRSAYERITRKTGNS